MGQSQTHYIDGRWLDDGGDEFTSENPSTGEVIWRGRGARSVEVDAAVAAARRAFESWADASLDDRVAVLKRFEAQLNEHKDALADAIGCEAGKPRWESLTEVAAMIGKIDISIEAYADRCAERTVEAGDAKGATHFKPHGVMAVLGPFNFPGHVPNGHIVPALLCGNAVVFKPSELTPLTAQRTIELWHAAGAPSGVINLVQGARETGAALADHDDIDGLLFTGGYSTGLALSRIFAEKPGKILALELGGNSPLVVHEAADLDAAAYMTILSAFSTAGQRCTCARRLIVPRGEGGDAFIERLIAMTKTIRVGLPDDDPPPFMGPVISKAAGDRVLAAQQQLVDDGAEALITCRPNGARPIFLSTGLIDVTNVNVRRDDEIFGPVLKIVRVDDFDDAIEEANATTYGLVAAVLTDHRELYERFRRRVRAGLINWNRPTTGASSRLPFGGVGASGNHRPTGYYAVDYCAYPVASLEAPRLSMPSKRVPGIDT